MIIDTGNETLGGDTPEAAPVAPDVTAAPAEGAPSTPDGAQAAPPPPAYVPNHVYRVKNEEKKFDDFLLPAIKDAETEKKVRELYERAHGLEHVKQDRTSLKQENQQLRGKIDQEYAPVMTTVQKLVEFRNKGDLDSFFTMADVPKKAVLEWALRYAQMSPEQRQAHDGRTTSDLRAQDMEAQQASYQDNVTRQMADYRERELGYVFQRQDVSPAVAQFDAQRGAGSFRAEVIRRGQFYAHQGQDISVDQAVSEVLRLVGWQGQQQPQAGGPPSPQAAGQPPTIPAQAPQALPVIPNIQGRGTSPAKQVFSSMADIKKRRRELEASGE